jgi:hypothetical protein
LGEKRNAKLGQDHAARRRTIACLTVAKFETAAAHMLQCRITPTASTFGHATIESWDIAQNCLCARSGMALIR